MPDALRIVSDGEQNLRIVMGGTGTVNIDGALAFAAADANFGQNPNIVGAAYLNNFPGATATTLYGIDTNRDILVTQNPANSGTLQTVGSLGVNVAAADIVGFDISSGNVAYAALRLDGETVSKLYTINLTSGAATFVVGRGAATDATAGNEGVIGASRGGSPAIVAIAIAPPVVEFQRAAFFAKEGNGVGKVVVVRSGDTTGTVSVNYAASAGTALAGDDFTPVGGAISFSPADTYRKFDVPLVDNNTQEPDENINLTLTTPAGGGQATLGAQSQSVLTVLDDDGRNRFFRWLAWEAFGDGWWFGRRFS